MTSSNKQAGLMGPVRRFGRVALLAGVSTMAVGALAPAQAQNNGSEDVITVTGVRGSLEQAMDIKRDAHGVVDAISADDIGSFPDTNLAESLQRITGVSINRVNGEGSLVTVRGFGSGFTLVTLNGRTMPTANVETVGGDQNADFATGDSRSFDFSNLASEGVRTLEVYKTGRAEIASGGIGGTVNIATRRPLDNPDGLTGTIGVQGMHDTGVVTGSDLTPELTGLLSWANPEETVGVSLFGSVQRRDSASRSATVNGWNVERGSAFLDPANGRVSAGTTITNSPDPNQLVAYPNDSRYHLAQAERERINGQLVFQFRPTNALTLTADATYARNDIDEQRTDQTNWFNRPFNQVTFDGNPVVASTLFLQENIAGVKDTGFEQQYRATRDTLQSFGFNAEWWLSDDFSLTFDAHTSSSESTPNNPMGVSSTLISMGAPVIAAHSVDFSSGFPVQSITIDDSVRGNGNGVLDVGDIGTQIARTIASSQEHDIDEFRLDAGWDLGNGSRFDAGIGYRSSTMVQQRSQTQQTLGDWGISNVGDVEQYAAGMLESYCLTCLFDSYDPMSSGDSLVAFRGNAVDIYNALSPVYAGMGNPVSATGEDFNQVDEEIWSAYAQVIMEGELMGRPASFVAGVRYEDTSVESTALVAVPEAIIWQSDNDFTIQLSNTVQPVSSTGSYDNVLPSLDFQIEIVDDVIARASFSNTIARPSYGDLFVADDADTPPRPTALGGIASGSTGNAGLLPLESDNFDVSLEWYYDDASYVSIGFFDKRVRNFVGTGQTTRNLFGLRDPSSGAAGTRSGDAVDALGAIGADPTDVNLFTMTALIEQRGSVAAATAEFQANYSGGALDQAFIDAILAAYDVTPNASDPLFQFEVTGPINNREGKIHGLEIAAQHFFGDTGFGVQANYTLVEGDVSIDVGADPSVDQFALVGLSDTANLTLIYEKHGLSARLAYNWRDEFLSQTNRGGGSRNPVFVEAFGQLDLNVSYDVTDDLVVSFEAINITGEDLRTFGRDSSNVWFAQELDPRYLLGARYRF
ncbi:TonB-dependent receptor [Maricaulis maris]|uniref:TonB-dependent receptor n=1 Tax=Maricaulis maris TaxID=74318 RepID=A0A495D3U3_9PROT|nr:TonB-dependent receptor [Maricaulis maris]RKQ96552.1 TonB-dependent receptor [Maricaulis maris]